MVSTGSEAFLPGGPERRASSPRTGNPKMGWQAASRKIPVEAEYTVRLLARHLPEEADLVRGIRQGVSPLPGDVMALLMFNLKINLLV
jgi:hypothetical protein